MSKQTRISNSDKLSVLEKLKRFSFPSFFFLLMIFTISEFVLFSAGGGNWKPFALSQLIKIFFSFIIYFLATFINIKFWIKSSYFIYIFTFILIFLVTFIGHKGMGAQRWLNLGFIHIQPSELIKVSIVLILARYFAWKNSVESAQLKNYLIPILIVLLPFLLIMLQPDLGTALSIVIISIGIFYIAGAKKQWFIIGSILAILSTPIIWFVGLHDYQKNRIITFLNPDHDIRKTGYQINQAKIAFGSGGFTGKGFISGTQSQQSFLPEKHTDFIFTMIGEEFGFIGAILLLSLYTTLFFILYFISKSSRNRFGQLFCFGFMLNFFTYYFINISMVLGIIPTVGVPLPLVSFGGSSLLSLMFGFGLCQNVNINKEQQLSAKGL